MKKTWFLSVGLLVLLSTAAAISAGGRPLTTQMTGGAEVPGPGDPDGSGTARITVNPGKAEVCYQLSVRDISTATLAHVHVGEAGASGPPVVTLGPPTSGQSDGCISVDRDLALAIIKNPENYYVNVHTGDFPNGAIRGQLR